MSQFTKKKFVFIAVLVMFCASVLAVKCEEDCEPGVQDMLATIMSPNQQSSIQVQALKRDILRRLQEKLQNEAIDEDWYQPKRSYSSLARWNNLPYKRSLEALARGGYLRARSDENDDPNLKRSIPNMAKNGQLPNYQTDDVEKRGIESLARNGELHHKRETQDVSDLYEKRNIGSLARNYNFPTNFGKRFFYGYYPAEDKRNIASLAREGMKINGKRNAAALLRQDNYINEARSEDDQKPDGTIDDSKRNIASIKAQYQPKFKRSVEGSTEKRQKREADYYDLTNDESSVYPNQNLIDYEELLRELAGEYATPEKRFLGSVARSGWFRPSSSSRYLSTSKRHIGSLARLGWLPSFRSARRFNRSGRSSNECELRSTSADGEGQDNTITQDSLSLDDKRLLLQPFVNRILLQRQLLRQPSIE